MDRKFRGRGSSCKKDLYKNPLSGEGGPAVAGTVDKGETYEENIIKEAEEELGLKNMKFEKGPKTKTDGEYNHFTQWFTCKINLPVSKFKVQEKEVAEIKWFSKEDLKEQIKKNPEEFVPQMGEYLGLFGG